MEHLLEEHSGELTVMTLALLVLITLLVLIPQALRAHQRLAEMQHEERLRALEQGHRLLPPSYRSRAAGRTAFIVPMVVISTAGTVTCFLAAYRSENLFSVSLLVWVVAGTVSLAAITGGVALLGRLAQLHTDEEDEVPENPLQP